MTLFWDALMAVWGSEPTISEPPPTATPSLTLTTNAYCNKGVQYNSDYLTVYPGFGAGAEGSTGYVCKMYLNGVYNRNIAFTTGSFTVGLGRVAGSSGSVGRTSVNYQVRLDIVDATGNVRSQNYSNTIEYTSGTCPPF